VITFTDNQDFARVHCLRSKLQLRWWAWWWQHGNRWWWRCWVCFMFSSRLCTPQWKGCHLLCVVCACTLPPGKNLYSANTMPWLLVRVEIMAFLFIIQIL